MSEGQGSISYTGRQGAVPPFVNVQGARNGTSLDSSAFVVLGQDVGEAGNPARLLSDREVDLDGFVLNFIDSSNVSGSLVRIGDSMVNFGTDDTYIFGDPQTGSLNLSGGQPGVADDTESSIQLVGITQSPTSTRKAVAIRQGWTDDTADATGLSIEIAGVKVAQGRPLQIQFNAATIFFVDQDANISTDGNMECGGSIKTGPPNNSAANWLLGQLLSGAVVPDAANFLEVNVAGVVHKIIVAA